MEPIRKTVTRKWDDRKQRLVLTSDRLALIAVLAFPIIAGLELYFKNRYGDPGTVYLCGLWTLVYGIWLLMAHIARRQGPMRLRVWAKQQGGDLEETVCFADDFFEVSLAGYFLCRYEWASLSAFRDTRRWLRFTIGGIDFLVAKRHFSQEELEQIRALLVTKLRASDAALRRNH